MSNAIFFLLNLADAGLTWLGLSLGASEVMPLKILDGNVALMMMVKMLFVCGLMYWVTKRRSDVLWYSNFLMFGVVFWNFWQIMILTTMGGNDV